MPTLAIDKGFITDLAKMEKPVVKRVTEVFDEFDAATHTGLHLEKIANARNPRFRSIPIDQAWRGIVLAPVTGDVYTLLKVLHHDDAYAWAQRSNASVNSATGGIEICDEAELDRQIPEITEAAKNAGTPIFAHIKDGELTMLGIDKKVLAFARTVADASQLDAAKSSLPETKWDVLFGLAAGFSPEEVWADLGAQILNDPVDTEDIDAAIPRSSDRVVLVSGPDELMDVFAYPFATWRVYLHPTRRAVVDAAYKGPARVTGGPGTGKTVVALHRANMLAKRGHGKVLVTTFTSTLSETLQSGLDMLVDDEEVESRIQVSHVDRIAHRVFRRTHGAPHLLGSEDEKALWAGLIDELGLTFTAVFLSEEWRQVVLARRISTADAYLPAKRTGRGRALGPVQRAQVWQAIWEFEQTLIQQGVWTHETIRREATRLLEESSAKPFRHIIIDEAQDLSPDQWRLLRASVAEAPDDIFIAGDTHQRICDNRVSLREVGINIAGRSSRLNINYRTTAEILGCSLGLLHGEAIDDMEGGLDPVAGCNGEANMKLALRGLEGKTTDPYLAGWRKRVGPTLGHLPITMITNGAVDRAVHAWISDDCSRSTVKNSLAVLVRVMEQAVRDGLIDRNPARISGWQREYKLAEDELDNPRSLALPDWAALMALADALVAESADQYQGWGDAVIFEACTAARIGEVSGCLVRDINTDDWIWTVRRQTTPSPGELAEGRTTATGGGLVDKNTKGRRARQVPLIDAIREMVQRRIDLAGGKPDARLFNGPRGGRISTATLRDATSWDEVIAKLGYEQLKRHSLRHTGLTWMADAGVPVHVLRKIAGHADLSTTQRYLHPDRQSVASAGDLCQVSVPA